MKIQWIDHGMTEAMVIIGWFKKFYAHVVRTGTTLEYPWGEMTRHTTRWNHKDTGRHISGDICVELEKRRNAEFSRRTEEENASREWRPLTKLPKVKLVKDGK